MSGGLDQARMDSANATNAQNDALSGMISGVGSAVGAGIKGGAFSKGASAPEGAVIDPDVTVEDTIINEGFIDGDFNASTNQGTAEV